MIGLYISLFITSIVFVLITAGIFFFSLEKEPGLVITLLICLVFFLGIGAAANLSIYDAIETNQVSQRTKVENIGFNYLYKGIKNDDEMCLYVEGDDGLDVIYCEELAQ